jgi:hypothetical protein
MIREEENKMKCTLMNKNIPVVQVQIDDDTAAIINKMLWSQPF